MKPDWSKVLVDFNEEGMMDKVLANPELKKKMLEDFGYGDCNISNDELPYVCYVIENLGGIKSPKNRLKAAKAMTIVTEIAKIACEKDMDYEKLGVATKQILTDADIIKDMD